MERAGRDACLGAQMPDSPTRSQFRAQKAFALVSKVKEQSWAKSYGRLCLRLPSLILQCGLCQTLAFLESKGDPKGNDRKRAYAALLQDLSTAVYSAEAEPARGELPKLAEEARSATVQRYLWLTRESLSCSQWFKRYAEAVLRVEPGEDEGGEAA